MTTTPISVYGRTSRLQERGISVTKWPERAATRFDRAPPAKGSMSTNDPAGVESTGTTTYSQPTVIDWNGPFCEADAYGGTTGYTYVRCPECHVEVLTHHREHASHRAGCRHQ